MSKRYGRNQKRRHVEEIKDIKRKLEINDNINRSIINTLQEKLNRARRNTEEMVSMIENICEYSSVLPPKTMDGNLAYDTFRLPTKPQRHILQRTWSKSIVNLHALNIYINEHYETFSKCVHMTYNGNHSAYLISREAILTTPLYKLVEQYAPQIANELIYHLKESLRG